MNQIIVIDDSRELETDSNVNHFKSSSLGLGYLTMIWTNQQRYRFDEFLIHELYLDHDLGKNDDIMMVVNWLEVIAIKEMPLIVDTIYVHSMNPVGGTAVYASLSRFYNVKRISLPKEMRNVDG